jgi:hypothetical protein
MKDMPLDIWGRFQAERMPYDDRKLIWAFKIARARLVNVCFWPKADIELGTSHVRFEDRADLDR